MCGAQGQQFARQLMSIQPARLAFQLDAEHWGLMTRGPHADQRRAEYRRMQIENRFAWDRVERPIGGPNAMRLATAEPQPTAIIHITEIARAMPNSPERIGNFY